MDIIISPLAQKQLKKLPKLIQFSVASIVRNFSIDNKTSNIKLLKGYKNIYRIRIGNYRIVYRNNDKKVYIILISHRKEAYLHLKRIVG